MAPWRHRTIQTVSYQKVDLLWKDYFKDPSMWCDERLTKNNIGLPDFRHMTKFNFLWIDGQCNPSWIHEELMRKSIIKPVYGPLNYDRTKCQDDFPFMFLIKDCAKKKDLDRGTSLHKEIMERGFLRKSLYLANALIGMYAKCGFFTKAHKILEEVPVRDTISWSALITGYVQHGQGHKALNCFDQMQNEGLSPDEFTFSSILKACGSTGSIDKGREIHEKIVNSGILERNVVVANALVDMYARCGFVAKAHEVLVQLPVRDVVSWNILITGYAQQGQGHEALNCFEEMKTDGISPNAVTFISILKGCGCIRALDKGNQIHQEIVDKNLLCKDVVVGGALVDMYVKCGLVTKAQEVLKEVPDRNVFCWSSISSGYTQQGQGHEALLCFERMQSEGLSPDVVSFVCVLQACGSIGAIDKGQQIHGMISINGLLEKESVLGNALVDMYTKCGALEKGQEVLHGLALHNIVSWTSLISGYVEHGQCQEAINYFEQMQSEGVSPNAITFICVVKACGNIRAINKGEEIHKEIVSRNLLKKDLELGNAMVDMYCKCGVLAKAHKVLEGLPIRDTVSWNTLIAGYTKQGQVHEAFKFFEWMHNEGFSPDAVTFLCILKACAITGAIDKGRLIHDEIVNRGLFGKDIVLGNALVDMYAKCGMLNHAAKVLEELHFRDVISWSTLIAGYAQQGQWQEALRCYERMQAEDLHPNAVTYLCLLSACSHSGLLDDAQKLFDDMAELFGILPTEDHHIRMVAIFGCAGHFDKAISMIEVMPSFQNPAIWLVLLGACRKWWNVKLGRLAFDQVVQMDSDSSAAYVLMANIFEAVGMEEDARNVEIIRQKYSV